ncbi:MAG: bifunctional methylenetetrahydrofolate dehydrogenase/methenyltetrahydrofolate cyclohydrolase FolD [Maricaulaceae bacterium]|jgi:methylenetetrahydrofolate dehydrogenase (NADP+)/methenyltetrahydrofolate cyclohydrolase
MTAERLAGGPIAEKIRETVAVAAAKLKAEHGVTPGLAVVLVGDDPASAIYVRNKVKETEEAGMFSIAHRLPASTPEDEVVALVAKLNADDAIDGILVQLPLPDHIDEMRVIEQIDPDKDVDGLTEASAGRLTLGKPGLRPCTPAGCVIMAKSVLGDDLSGLHCVVVGRSILVGKPAAALFLAENCTVTIAHSRTKDLPNLCKTADILVLAVGRPEMATGDWIKLGATVIDVGLNRIPAPEKGEGKTRIVGDADYASVAEVAAHVTPVPGGVGKMTVAGLLRNTVLAAAARRGLETPDV